MPSTHFFGPLIGTADVEPHLDILVDGFGFAVAERAGLSQRQVRDRLGPVGRRAELIVLLAPESESGVCLLEFDPAGSTSVSGCFGPIEIQVDDPAALLERLREAGSESALTEEDGSDRTWSGTVRADDGVRYALSAGGSSAAPSVLRGVAVAGGECEAVSAFYEALGLSPAGAGAAISAPELRLVAEEGAEPASLPRPVDLGMLALCLWVDDVDALAEAATQAGGEEIHRSTDGGSLWLRGPNGALHWLIRAAG